MIPTARNVLTRPPTGRYFSAALPSDCFAIDFPGRAICPGQGLLVFPTSPSGEQPDCPSLRASNEHSFIVRVLRARRAPGRSLPILLRPRVAQARGSSRPPRPFFSILLEHEEEVKVIHVRAGGTRDDELLELL